MAKRTKAVDQDRYLIERGGIYYYRRRVPLDMDGQDTRFPQVRATLETDDLAIARRKRDAHEAADDELWMSLRAGAVEPDTAKAAYKAALRRAETLGFIYRPAGEIAQQPLDEIVQRVVALMSDKTPAPVADAALGLIDQPKVKISEAFEVYCDDIVRDELAGKSAVQKAMWRKVKLRAVTNFIDLNGDLAMDDIRRDHAQKVYRFWLDRIAPKQGSATHSSSSGNRDVGNLRTLYGAYFDHMGEPDRTNPFDKLSYSKRRQKSRPPFPVDWIKTKIMAPGAMASMNLESRAIILALIETGARPSEICNQRTETIVLDHEIPHLRIEPRDDPDDPREIKTESSVRSVPLIGIALEVFKLFPHGFPTYKDRESSMSTAMNRFFNRNNLFPTPRHKIYSFRHSFEDRMKEAGLEDELRRILMGHSIDRPKYGDGGSLAWRYAELRKIELPFDLAILKDGRGLMPSRHPSP